MLLNTWIINLILVVAIRIGALPVVIEKTEKWARTEWSISCDNYIPSFIQISQQNTQVRNENLDMVVLVNDDGRCETNFMMQEKSLYDGRPLDLNERFVSKYSRFPKTARFRTQQWQTIASFIILKL